MKYPVRTISEYHITYGLLPYKRNQDIIRIQPLDDGKYIVCVVDGWNHPEELPGDEPGCTVAEMVSAEYPGLFLSISNEDLHKRAWLAADEMEKRVIAAYPANASAVAMILFHGVIPDDILVSVGDVEVYLWNGKEWYKPKEISDHWIDPTKYPSNVSHFFGHTFRSDDPIFGHEPDIIELTPNTPLIIASDGIKDVLSIKDINAIVGIPHRQSPREIIKKLSEEIHIRKTQKDDISLLARV